MIRKLSTAVNHEVLVNDVANVTWERGDYAFELVKQVYKIKKQEPVFMARTTGKIAWNGTQYSPSQKKRLLKIIIKALPLAIEFEFYRKDKAWKWEQL